MLKQYESITKTLTYRVEGRLWHFYSFEEAKQQVACESSTSLGVPSSCNRHVVYQTAKCSAP